MPAFALASYKQRAGTAAAVVIDDQLYDLREAARAARVGGLDRRWSEGGVEAMIAAWPRAGAWLKKVAKPIAAAVAARKLKPVGALDRKAVAPYRPQRIFCAASNYVDHAREMASVLAAKSESKPYMFLKLQNAVIGPHEAVRKPAETERLDWEVELAAVIGRRARRISVDKALGCVAGYSIVNDVSARDLNSRSDYPFKFDWFQGKAHDTFAPFGPCIVPAWLIKDPQTVSLKLIVNGATMQDDTTANMIWKVAEQIAYLSTIVTLEPGDVIATGTPAGVGMGRGVYLKPGDLMHAVIPEIGTLANPVVAEKT
jgi:2,4-didehydro-3-deoxy-L-rhamnonate hydrolase